MKVAFIGCVDASHAALRQVLDHPDAEVVGVVTRRESGFNADFRSLEPLAKEHGVPVFIAEANKQDSLADWLEGTAPDVVYCFGWSYLLKAEVLGVAPLGVVGYHPAALPRNRGRHPIIWALALGLEETASTYFFMDESADSGDILSQRAVPIAYEDDAATLYARLVETSREQIREFTAQLAAGTASRTPQDHARANYWRKRGRADGRIDWRMASRGIYNLVRALTRPYPGAHFDHESGEVKVWRVEETGLRHSAGIANLEPGRILAADHEGFDVRCGDTAIRVVDWDRAYVPVIGSCLQ